MFVNEKDPYAALFAGLVFLTLPFALAVHDALAFVFGRTGLLVSVSDGGFGWRGGWEAWCGLCMACLRF
ncbi:2-oxoglutarate translocator [Neisseria meningitidis]|nr:2-oxoglutarate translocator [Neisseria meningitidis]